MTDNTIHIIGLGVAETAELTASSNQALTNADIVIGAERQLAVVNQQLKSTQQRIVLPKLAELTTIIQNNADQSIAVLASGDPLYYGIGRWFSTRFETARLQFHPAVSSIQAACHRLGVALQDVNVISLHGRPLASLRTQLKRQQRLLILTDQHSQPQRLAQECLAAGFNDSTITVCENLGYQKETISRFFVGELSQLDRNFDPLHVSYIEVLGHGGVLPEFPGIPDHHFVTGEVAGKGMISKREVRLSILSYMQVNKGDVVWDIGAGCGGVAVEMALWQPQADVYALEFHPQRLEYLHQNQQRFGVVKNLHIIEGRAPEALAKLPAPTKVFIGGSDGELEQLLVNIWQLLPENGVLVASGVINTTKQQLQAFAKTLKPAQVESVELSVKRGELVKGESSQHELSYTAKLPVEIFKLTKGDV